MSDSTFFAQRVATELQLPMSGVAAALELFAEGGTIPFVARYRKEATGQLDEVQLRDIQEKHTYITEMEDRRSSILASIEEQGKMTDRLKKALMACDTKSSLEDLYLPYKPKRRTRATIAKEKGLLPLAELIKTQPLEGNPEEEAQRFVNAEKKVDDVKAALKGARDIVAEGIAETAALRGELREFFSRSAVICSQATKEAKDKRTKFEQYYDFAEPAQSIPSHRFLAIRRGERDGALRVKVEVEREQALAIIHKHHPAIAASPWAQEFALASEDAFDRLLTTAVETDLRVELKMRSDKEAIDVFADNLRNLLLSAPLGGKSVLGIDPGQRTGSKCVAVDDTGKFLDNLTLYLVGGAGSEQKARHDILSLVKKYQPMAIAVGNGTGGRETESFVRKTLSEAEHKDIIVVSVNESGASIYSASDVAREEFPDLDLTIRGAISIARRLQDPLAELVKIDPKSIGVGQYQHDVNQGQLAKSLERVVESCVNAVGVNLNTASAPLLARVAGISAGLAKKIIAHREQSGRFSRRQELKKVVGLGPKAFEQAAGFLRIPDSDLALDHSAVHPERYALVERMAKDLGCGLDAMIGDRDKIKSIDIKNYIGEGVGEPTLRDIVQELQKPGRDPRKSFEPPRFREDVHSLTDLKIGMRFEGIVTNVTAFGAFVDIGVHQDGLVHISKLADHFVNDPREVAKAGDKLNVVVIELDIERKRISLSARSDEDLSSAKKQESADSQKGQGGRARRNSSGRRDNRPQQSPQSSASGFSNNPFAAAFKKS